VRQQNADRDAVTAASAAAGRGLVQANGSSNEGRESLLIDFRLRVSEDNILALNELTTSTGQ
jgi:hypothetical protein